MASSWLQPPTLRLYLEPCLLEFTEGKQRPAAVRVWEMILDNISILNVIAASDYCVTIRSQALYHEHGNSHPCRKLWRKAVKLLISGQMNGSVLTDLTLLLSLYHAAFFPSPFCLVSLFPYRQVRGLKRAWRSDRLTPVWLPEGRDWEFL